MYVIELRIVAKVFGLKRERDQVRVLICSPQHVVCTVHERQHLLPAAVSLLEMLTDI